MTDKEYPQKLLQMKSPPKKIYTEGNLELLNRTAIAIVGSRKCTEYGWKQALHFSKELSRNGICIVSGMALGIDKAAHMGAKREKGKTIAVLGGGFHHLYPEENKELFFEILKQGGCVITEYPPDEKVKSSNFPKRNRIISGLSVGTLVIEAALRSGSLITARYTKEQNKSIFCIPSNIGGNTSIGTNNLIKQGAILTTEIDDILKKLQIKKIVEEKKKQNKKQVDKSYLSVYNALENMPISVDKIANRSKKTIAEVYQILTMLEIEGFIKSCPGNSYMLLEKEEDDEF